MDDTTLHTTPSAEQLLTQTVVLDRLKVAMAMQLDRQLADRLEDDVADSLERDRREGKVRPTGEHLLESATFKLIEDAMLGRITGLLTSFVLAEKIVDKTHAESVVFEMPASWWQHVKRDVLHRIPWLGGLLGQLWPWYASYERHAFFADFTQYANFPASPLKTPPTVHAYVVVPHERLNTEIDVEAVEGPRSR